MRFSMVPALAIVVVSFSNVIASDSQSFVSGGATFTVSTGSGQGNCLVQAGVITCSDGNGNSATGDTSHGCLSRTGSGYCGLVAYTLGDGDLDVACPGGETYRLNTSDEGGGNCSLQQNQAGQTTGGSCDDGEGNTSGADCSANGGQGACTGRTGTGSCICVTCD